MDIKLGDSGYNRYLDKCIKGISSPTRSDTFDPFSDPVF